MHGSYIDELSVCLICPAYGILLLAVGVVKRDMRLKVMKEGSEGLEI